MDEKAHSITSSGTAVAERPAEGEAIATKTILLLDSAAVFLRFEETVLQRSGWRILRASTGAQALDILGRGHVDLLVMDPHLPDLLGEHVIRAIRSMPAMRTMAILMVTASGQQGTVERCLAEGCSAILFKPVSRRTLCATVEQLLSIPARRHLRTLVRLQVEGAEGNRAFFGNTVNLSAGGMLVESPTEVIEGDRLDLRFQLPGDPDPVVVTASVVRVQGELASGHSTFGLTFEHLEDSDRRRIDAFVRASAAEAEECNENIDAG